METKSIQNGRFKATKVNEKRAVIDGLVIFRHRDGIAFELNGQLTSVNDKEKSRRGNPDLYHKLNNILLDLGIELGDYKPVEKPNGNLEDDLE